MKLSYLLLISLSAFGEFSYFGNHSAELGYTSNANSEIDGFEDHDTFWSLFTENGLSNGNFFPSAQLYYTDFVHENANDLFKINLKFKYTKEINPKFKPSVWVDFFLAKYLHQDSGNTDISFSHRGFKFGVKNSQEINSESKINYGFEFIHRKFVNFYDRKDNTITIFTEYNYQFNSSTSVNGDLGLQSTNSTIDYYSNRGFNFEIGAEKDFNVNTNSYTSLGFTRKTYNDRRIVRTIDTKSRRINTNIQSESDNLWEFNLGLEYNFRKNYFLNPELNFLANNSNNDFNEYDEFNTSIKFGAYF